jgi:hypothetical protein
MRTRNYTKSINFTPEQIEYIKELREKLSQEIGVDFSLNQIVLYALKKLED